MDAQCIDQLQIKSDDDDNDDDDNGGVNVKSVAEHDAEQNRKENKEISKILKLL